MQGINYVAWWGAIVATLVLVWDILKWFRSGPKIRNIIQLDTVYPDSRILKVEKQQDYEEIALAKYCHIEFVNVGSSPTTIIGISAQAVGRDGVRAGYDSRRFIAHHGKGLPHVLPPGEVWSCRIEMADLYQLARRESPSIEVNVSHRRKPMIIRTGISANKANPVDVEHQRDRPATLDTED